MAAAKDSDAELPLRREADSLSISRRLIRSTTQKLKSIMVIGCISLYVRDNKSSLPVKTADCCSNDNSEAQQCCLSSTSSSFLLDDVLQMILLRLPLPSLMAARCVCKKWRYMTTTPHFIKMRSEGYCRTPWLFLFALGKRAYRSGEIQVLDVSVNQWHRISHPKLKNIDGFSVLSAGIDIYIVGGNSSSLLAKNNIKTNRGVLLFCPLTGLWRNLAPMKWPRAMPALGAFEVPMDYNIFQRTSGSQEPIDFSDSKDANDGGLKRGDHVKFAIIVVGGYGFQNQPLGTGEIYDPASNRWVEISRLPREFGKVCSGAVLGRVFYVYSEAHKLASYNLERDFWITIQINQPAPIIGEYYPKLVSCRGRLLVLSVQHIRRGAFHKVLKKLWELDLNFCTMNEVSIHPGEVTDLKTAYTADRERIYSADLSSRFAQDGQVATIFTTDTETNWKCISTRHIPDTFSRTAKSMAVLRL